MSDNYAEIDVSGPASKHIANSVIGSLGVAVDEVSEIEVTLTTENGDDTVTQFASEGPHAGRIARSMIGSLDHDETPPSAITVRLRTDAQERDDDSSDDSNGRAPADKDTLEKQREAALGTTRNVENGRESKGNFLPEPRVDEPVPVGNGTRLHEALQLLERYHEEHGDDAWATANELYRFGGEDFPHAESLGASLSPVFLDHALVEREKRKLKQGGATIAYRLNDAGREELERHRQQEAAQ